MSHKYLAYTVVFLVGLESVKSETSWILTFSTTPRVRLRPMSVLNLFHRLGYYGEVAVDLLASLLRVFFWFSGSTLTHGPFNRRA